MSSLLIPKHWRFNLPLLMGHLKKNAGHLVRTTTAPRHLVNNCGTGCSDWLPCTRPSSYEISGATTTLTDESGNVCSSMIPNGSRPFAWVDCDHYVSLGGCVFGFDFISCFAFSVLSKIGSDYVLTFVLQYRTLYGGITLGSDFVYEYVHDDSTCPSGTIALTYVSEYHDAGVWSVNPVTPSGIEITI